MERRKRGTSRSTCVHYWHLDSEDNGVCKFCGERRDFRALRRFTINNDFLYPNHEDWKAKREVVDARY
jgi:hypothetical protein